MVARSRLISSPTTRTTRRLATRRQRRHVSMPNIGVAISRARLLRHVCYVRRSPITSGFTLLVTLCVAELSSQ